MLHPRYQSALCLALGGLVLGTVACQDIQEFETAPPDRSRPFERTDRLFEDDDDNPVCFNDNGVNNSVIINGKVDLTRNPRQGFKGQRGIDDDEIVGFPDRRNGPLFGHEECSVGTKNWAGGYYKAAGMPPTMGEWCEAYGLASDCQSSNLNLIPEGEDPFDLQISYFNAHALPVFRVTLCNSDKMKRPDGTPVVDPETGAGYACVNLNYACPQRVRPGLLSNAEEGDEFEDVVCDPFGEDLDDPNCAPCEAVSVVMHYDIPPGGDKPVVVFGAYRGVGGEAPLMDRIDLNFSGVEDTFEVIPNVCQSCHGGHPYEPLDIKDPSATDIDLQAQFLPINPRFALKDNQELFDFVDRKIPFEDAVMDLQPRTPDFDVEVDARGNIDFSKLRLVKKDNGAFEPLRPDISADMEDTLEINRLIRLISPLAANEETLRGLDESFRDALESDDVADALADIELHARDEIPDGWRGNPERENFYRLVAEHCNDGCHLALPPPLDFQSFDSFANYRDVIARDMCNDFSMPHSPESFNLFWSKSERVGDDTRLNKDRNGDLLAFGDEEGRRGDVELFLEFEDIGWKAIAPDVDKCGIPGLAVTFLGNVEFASDLTLDKKKEECVKEHTGEIPRGFISCNALCNDVVVETERFDRAARVNKVICDDLTEVLGCDDNGDLIGGRCDKTVERKRP